MNVLRHCECCEEAIPDGQEYVHPEDGDSYCRRCVIDLLGAERDALTRQLAGAVEALDLLLSPIVGSAEFVETETARRLLAAKETLDRLRGQ